MNFWNKKKSELVLVCDIGSASVGAALALFEPEKKPKILATSRMPIAIQENFDKKALEIVMLRFFEQTLGEISKKLITDDIKNTGIKRIEKAYCIYASPWFHSMSRTIRIQKDDVFSVDENELEHTMDLEEKEFEKELIAKKTEDSPLGDIRMIERELIRVKLNGYETNDPFKKKVNSAEFTMYMSVVSNQIFVETNKLLDKYFHIENVFSYSFPLASFLSVRETFKGEGNFLLIDVTGEGTDVTLVEDGIIESTCSLLLGRNDLIREVAKTSNLDFNSVLSMLNMHKDDGLNEESKKNLDNSIQSFGANWTAKLNEAFDRCFLYKNVPTKIFLTIDEDVSVIFNKYILENQQKLTAPNVFILKTEFFSDKVDFAKFILNDPFLFIDTHFVSLQKKSIK